MEKTCMICGKACGKDRYFKNVKGEYLHTDCMDTYLEPLEKEPTFLDQLLRPRYTKWTSFVYCQECQRPMRKDRCWSAIEREGNAFWMNRYCLACQGQVMGIVPLWFLGLLLFLCALEMYIGEEGNIFFVFLFASIVLRLVQQLRYKPIYDRWVSIHGSNSETWPRPRRIRSEQELDSSKEREL